jgi:hypothetical protein
MLQCAKRPPPLQFCFTVVAPAGKVHKPSGQVKVVLGWTDRDAAIRMYEHIREAISSCSPTVGQMDALRHQVRVCGAA